MPVPPPPRRIVPREELNARAARDAAKAELEKTIKELDSNIAKTIKEHKGLLALVETGQFSSNTMEASIATARELITDLQTERAMVQAKLKAL